MIHYLHTMTLSCDAPGCNEDEAYKGVHSDYEAFRKEANLVLYRHGWVLSKGKHYCANCIRIRDEKKQANRPIQGR